MFKLFAEKINSSAFLVPLGKRKERLQLLFPFLPSGFINTNLFSTPTIVLINEVFSVTEDYEEMTS